MKSQRLIILLIIFLLIFPGCSRKIYKVAYPTLSDKKYDSEFPYKSCSGELERILLSVKKLTSIAYYKRYLFDTDTYVSLNDVRLNRFQKMATSIEYHNNSVIGTATILYAAGHHVALLTCAHVVDFPDTVLVFYREVDGSQRYLQSISIKEKQRNYVADFPEGGELEILAMDKENDLALLGKEFIRKPRINLQVFPYPFGRARELSWGNFVYLLGYPKGYKMVTKGIVSQPNRNKKHFFLVDALFNKGFSGGVVLAVRDGVPNFELVGIANSVAADYEYLLVPPDTVVKSGYDPYLPYRGDIYIEFRKYINYGITFVISAETIKKFLQKNQYRLEEMGYNLTDLF